MRATGNDLHLADHAVYVERITELAIGVALFSGGLRLRLRWRDPAWRPASSSRAR